jgi:hypothetical protein
VPEARGYHARLGTLARLAGIRIPTCHSKPQNRNASQVLVTDRLTVHDKRRTGDGYLVTEARFARAGIYEYAGRDVGKPNMDTVRVYRPEGEVFNDAAMASFAHKPITNDHPSDNVTADTWKRGWLHRWPRGS